MEPQTQTIELQEIHNTVNELAEKNKELYDIVKELTTHVKTTSIDEKLNNLTETVRQSLNSTKQYDIVENRINSITHDIKAMIVAKQKDYEQHYHILDKKYTKLKETQEEQFFKFTNIISSYQMLIFKIMNTSTMAPEEYQQINELMRNINSDRCDYKAYTPNSNIQPQSIINPLNSPPHQTGVHTPHPPPSQQHPSRRNSSVSFKLNIPKRLNEEEILSDSEYTT
jgi:hypothetical protein